MQKTLIKLLILQSLLLVLFASGCGFFAGRVEMMAAMAGGMMAISATLVVMMIFRRLPSVIPARMFYRAMVAGEIGKWIVVVVLGAFFLRQHPPLWVLLGFAATYSAYFWMMLLD